MTNKEKQLLLAQAVRLTSLGATVERERSKLTKMVEQGVSYCDSQMLAVLKRFNKADSEWKQLEKEHLELLTKIKANKN